ncbi:MAG: hypothetical protein IT428_33210 [Planctomycetaceae bacterium]|nr:hypothetical protein [Planctomycetaceae bacterium]
MLIVDILSRWLHVISAIVLMGGSIYVRFVLMPAAAQLPESEHNALRELVRKSWAKVVGAAIGLLLLSGLFNYVRAIKGDVKPSSLYHALIGTKMILSLVVFFLASALSGKAAAFEGIRRNARTWLGVTIALAAIIVALGSVVKVGGRTIGAKPVATIESTR